MYRLVRGLKKHFTLDITSVKHKEKHLGPTEYEKELHESLALLEQKLEDRQRANNELSECNDLL